MARYRRRLRDWNTERERQIEEFTITEKDLAKPKIENNYSKSATSTSMLKVSGRTGGDRNLYSAQPRDKTYKSYKVHIKNIN